MKIRLRTFQSAVSYGGEIPYAGECSQSMIWKFLIRVTAICWARLDSPYCNWLHINYLTGRGSWFILERCPYQRHDDRWTINRKRRGGGMRNVSVRTADFPTIGYSTTRLRVLTVTQTCSVTAGAVDVIAQGLPSPVHTYLLQESPSSCHLITTSAHPKRLM